MLPADPLAATLKEWVAIFMRRSMRNFVEYVRENGLSMTQVSALFHIRRDIGCGVSDLGENLGITSAAASQMLERLVQQKMILRSEDPDDRRVKQLFLTENGSRILQESINARQGWLDELAQTLNPAEKEQVMAGLQILIEKAKELDNLAIQEN